MERAIGAVFEFEGQGLEVVTSDRSCKNCYFEYKKECEKHKKTIGECCSKNRSDKKYIVFKEQK